jgi:hypothetical protein
MSELTKPSYLNVLIVEEFDTAVGKGRNWTKGGVAFPHAAGLARADLHDAIASRPVSGYISGNRAA